MYISLTSLYDNYIQSKSDLQDYNYGYDTLLQIHKDENGVSRSIIKFNLDKLNDYLDNHGLQYSDITSAVLNLYDISSIALLDNNYQSTNTFTNCDVEVLFLDMNFDEGIYSDTNSGTGYSNWLYASDGTVWTSSASGGSTTSYSGVSTITYSFTNSYESLTANIKTYLQQITSITSYDANFGFLIKLTDVYEGNDINYESKQFLSKQSKIKSYRPNILVKINKQYKDESRIYTSNRSNTFGIINYNNDLLLESITSIDSIYLKGVTSTTATVTSTITSITTGITFNTIVKGYHTFDFVIPSSISGYYYPYLDITYSTTSEAGINLTKSLTSDRKLTTTQFNNIINGKSKLSFIVDPTEQKIDITKAIHQFNIRSIYSDYGNIIKYFNFNTADEKVIKALEYKAYDEFSKVICDWEYCHYNDDQNFIIIDNSLLYENMKYFIDLRINSLYFSKTITFNTN